MKILAIVITAIAVIAGITTVSIIALADSVSEFDLRDLEGDE